jgi:hypothetical protein
MTNPPQNETAFLLGQLVADIKNLTLKIDELSSRFTSQQQDHEDRISKLEGWRKEIVVMLAAGSILLSVLGNIGVNYVNHNWIESSQTTQNK